MGYRVLSGFKAPILEQNPLKRFAIELKYALALIPAKPKDGEWKVPLPFDAQLRLANEKDMSRGVLMDLSKREVQIRKWGGDAIVVRLRENDVRWILERVKEGGRLKLAMAWVGRVRRSNLATFNVALVFAKEVKPIEARRVLVVDLNALHNGVVWGIIEDGKIVKRGVERPDLAKIGRLQKEISRLGSLCAKNDKRYCWQASAAKSRLYRSLRQLEDETAREIVEAAVRGKGHDRRRRAGGRVYEENRRGEEVRPAEKGDVEHGRLRKRVKQLAGLECLTAKSGSTPPYVPNAGP